MIRRPPRSTRPDPRFPYTTLFRALPQPHAHHQIVPAILSVGPLRDFIRPAMTVLRSTQAFRLRRAVEHGLSPRPPHQPPQRRRIDGPLSLGRSEEHTSELQSLMRISSAFFCLKKKTTTSK